MQHATGVCEKKRPLRKFDAKASFEVWSPASDVVFREESEVGVENSPPKKNIFLDINFGSSEMLKNRNF